MDNSFYTGEKKVPIPLVIGSIFLLFILFSLGFNHNKKAKSGPLSQNLLKSHEITNVTATSVAIVTCLSKSVPLELLISHKDDAVGPISVDDDRDISSNPQSRLCHYFSIKNIAPGSYSAKLISAGISASDKPIVFQTGEPITGAKAIPLWGKVVDTSDKPISTGIVIAYFDNAKPMSALVKNGDWLLPIHYLPYFPGDDTKFKIIITGVNGEKTEVKSVYKEVDKVSKTLVLGKKYDFTGSNLAQQSVLGQETELTTSLQKIDIIYPRADAIIPSFRPLFKGVALANKPVTIILDEFSSISKTKNKDETHKVTADKDGIWNFTPSADMASGFHNIVIKSEDENKKNTTVRRNYTLLKSGEAVLAEATTSATLTPTEAPVTPTDIVEPTIIEPTIAPTESVTPPLPRSGMNIYPLTFMSLSLIIVGIGLLVFYL